MVETRVESIRVSLVTQNRVVILKDVRNDRYLAIWIDPYVAEAIATELQQIVAPRPMTHDLLRNVIQELGGTITHILISDLHEGTYYARIVLDMAGRHVEVDSRSSDAIALAVRAKVPIYVDDSVMDKESVSLESGPGVTSNNIPDDLGLSSEDEVEAGPSAFRDFINSLDLEDFGQEKG